MNQRNRFVFCVCAVALATFLTTTATATEPRVDPGPDPGSVDGNCYAVTDVSSDHDALTKIDTADTDPVGNEATIGRTNTELLEAIAMRGGAMYGINHDRLGTIDLDTGAFTALGPVVGSGHGAGGGKHFRDIDAMGFEPETGYLYAVVQDSHKDLLIRIDPESGTTVAGAFGEGVDYVLIDKAGAEHIHSVEGLAFDPTDGELWVSVTGDHDFSYIMRIDKMTGGKLEEHRLPGSLHIEGMDIDDAGQMYVIGRDGSRGEYLWSVDKSNGQTGPAVRLDNGLDYEGVACRSTNTADLSVFLTSEEVTVYDDSTWAYEVQLSNRGPRDATQITVELTFGEGLALVSGDPQIGRFDDNTATWSLPVLAAGTTVSMTVVVEPNGRALGEAHVYAHGATTGEYPDRNPGNDDGSLAVTIEISPNGDLDNDGLTNSDEERLGTDPADRDSDGDGLLDGAEVGPDLDNPRDTDEDGNIDALDPDDDGDGILTRVEIGDSNIPGNDADDDGHVNWRDADADNDEIPDGEDGRGDVDDDGLLDYLDPDDTDGPAGDYDGDGLPNRQEEEIGTDPRDADSDDDGVRDAADGIHDTDADGLIDALDVDSDGDGLLDGTEIGLTVEDVGPDTDLETFRPDEDPGTTTNPDDPDTDDGGIYDGTEDVNLNGRIDEGERDPNNPADDADVEPNTDTDGDGLTDMVEDAIGTDPNDADSDDDGVRDGDEADPEIDHDDDGLIDALDPDSDNDGILDGTELGLTEPDVDTDVEVGNFVPDADPETTTSMVNPDTDGGTVSEGIEDANHNGAIDEGETDPNDPADDLQNTDGDGDGLTDADELIAGTDPADADSDNDGVPDGLDGTTDVDRDGLINALDPDSDGDGILDGTERGVVEPGPDTDVDQGNFVPDADPETTTDPNDPDTDDGSVADGIEDANRNGAIDEGETDPNNPADDVADSIVDADGDQLSDEVEAFLGTDPLDADSDDDGVLDGHEDDPSLDTDGDGAINALDPDSDGDQILDGTERGLIAADLHPDTTLEAGNFTGDQNPATTTSMVNPDTDGGTVWDGVEDANQNGRIDTGERDPNDAADDLRGDVDSDGDGLADELEERLGTDPADGDSDDDGLGDGVEGTADSDGDGIIDALDPDSDNDGILDGTEAGVTTDTAPADTDTDSPNFVPDEDPSTVTDPRDPDTDGGTVSDGVEDANHNGRVDTGEKDPLDPSDDVPGGNNGGNGNNGNNGDTSGDGDPNLDAGNDDFQPFVLGSGGCSVPSAAAPTGGMGALVLLVLLMIRRRR